MSSTEAQTGIQDLAARFAGSDLDDGVISGYRTRVDELCSDYSTGDPASLKSRSEAMLREIDELLDRRLTLTDHQHLLEQAGWLVLLIAALEYDLGLAESAEDTRQLAVRIGEDLQNPSILGWAYETAVWIEISNSNWSEAIRRADEALTLTGEHEPTGVAIQLTLERAEAYARLGDTENLRISLEEARRRLDHHEPPENPKNHFAFDPAKFDLRQMRALLVVGQDEEAERIAVKLRTELQNPDGTSRHPMRTSEILASLGLIEARRGNIDQAVELADQAIVIGRRSRLSFQQITSAVANELTKHDHLDSVRQFLDRRADLLQIDS